VGLAVKMIDCYLQPVLQSHEACCEINAVISCKFSVIVTPLHVNFKCDNNVRCLFNTFIMYYIVDTKGLNSDVKL